MMEPCPTTVKSKKIQAINKEAVHRICSGQVVLDLAVAVKELIENSLDSGADVIDIKLTDYGKTCITVIDNGSGITEQDFEGLGLKHHTSKLCEFEDLNDISTFGFRGEALSSLCSLSELNIVTKHSTSDHGFKLMFDKHGILITKEPYAREIGTTVNVRNIFKTLPVRAKEFERNLKKEYAHMIQVLYNYCLVAVDTKITCTNSVGNKASNIIVSTTSSNNIIDNVKCVFGSKSVTNLIQIEMESPNACALQEYNIPANTKVEFDWEFYISKCGHTCGRSSPDRQFFYVNGRPCDLSKINKLINSLYHKYNDKQYPFVYLNLKMIKDSADINVTPDKRTIFFTQERLILATLKYNLTSKWNGMQGNLTVKPAMDVKQTNLTKKRKMISPKTESPVKKLQLIKSISENEYIDTETKLQHDDIGRDTKLEHDHVNIKYNQNVQNDSMHNDSVESNISVSTKSLRVEMPMSMAIIKKRMLEKESLQKVIRTDIKTVKYRVEIANSQGTDAETELKRELTTESFKKMEIIGQFNLGFIITRLDTDLFIIDQHASDEKYRFEKLTKETKLKTQKMIIPKMLNLSTLNKTVLIDNQKIFKDNGFGFKINNEAESEQVQLTEIPVSGNWQFGQDDIEELIFLIREGNSQSENGPIPRPSRVRQMLASRACRSAVMIGTALNKTEMQRLTVQMGEMQNPWNCPHGRPTIRHLLSLFLINRQ